MDRPLTRRLRILLGIAFPAAAILGCALLYTGNLKVSCLFYRLTGLYCPGCGSGRAVLAILHGNVGRAVRNNVLLFLLGLPCGAIVLHEYARLVFPGLKLKPVYVSRRGAIWSIALLVVFWIVRNIPVFSFLAPI